MLLKLCFSGIISKSHLDIWEMHIWNGQFPHHPSAHKPHSCSHVCSLESSWGCRLHGNGRHSHRHGSVGWIWLWNWDILFDHSSTRSQGWPAPKYTFMYCSCGHWCDHKCTKWRSYWIHNESVNLIRKVFAVVKEKVSLGSFSYRLL